MRKLDLVVHCMDRRILVPHHYGRVGLCIELGNTKRLEERVLHVWCPVVEEPHAVNVAADFSDTLHKVPHIASLVEHAEVYVRVIVDRKLHDLLYGVVVSACDVILHCQLSPDGLGDYVVKHIPKSTAFHHFHVLLHETVLVGVFYFVGDGVRTEGHWRVSWRVSWSVSWGLCGISAVVLLWG